MDRAKATAQTYLEHVRNRYYEMEKKWEVKSIY